MSARRSLPRLLVAAALLLACLGAAQSDAEGGGSGRRRLQAAYAPWLPPDALSRGLSGAGNNAALRAFLNKLIAGGSRGRGRGVPDCRPPRREGGLLPPTTSCVPVGGRGAPPAHEPPPHQLPPAALPPAGKAVTVATVGGSVTHGTGAGDESQAYATRFFSWVNSTFPRDGLPQNQQHTFVNAGVGATTSAFFSMCSDVLVPQASHRGRGLARKTAPFLAAGLRSGGSEATPSIHTQLYS